MKVSVQYCPVCQRRSPHTLEPVSQAVFTVLFCLMVWPGLLYLWYAARRADRTARCMVDHDSLQAAREYDSVRELVKAIRTVNRRIDASPSTPTSQTIVKE
ncbi:hypothetical protein [Paraburkholderia sp. BL10I2N1]|uniref:hypothetical protein n=1 Tax=Paraburkholderia sp. BL10I2N1 TaxID=1938796 RepID=UPI00105E70DC|nr:hypothetical protein [Paraburkholderia sp. BL10I2N1]TDN70066.1 hypothetical protein B0G77_3515 [Paraburkholderia sp. BL10I2N1]